MPESQSPDKLTTIATIVMLIVMVIVILAAVGLLD